MRKLLLILVLELLVYGSPLRADGVPLDTFTLSATDGHMLSFDTWSMPASFDAVQAPVFFVDVSEAPLLTQITVSQNDLLLNCPGAFDCGGSSVAGEQDVHTPRSIYSTSGIGAAAINTFTPGTYLTDSPSWNVVISDGDIQFVNDGTLGTVCPTCFLRLDITDPPGIQSTPEPGTLGMLAFSLGVLALVSWRWLRLTTELCRDAGAGVPDVHSRR